MFGGIMRRNAWIAVIVCSLTSAAAWGQVRFKDPVVGVWPFGGTFNEASAPAVTATTSGFNLHGDVTIFAKTTPQMYTISASRQFQVGPLPVQVSLDYDWNYKIANGGGTVTDPTSSVSLHYGLMEYSSDLSNSYELAAFTRWDVQTQKGNGFTIFDGSALPTNNFVLSPTLTYEMFLQVDIDPGILPAGVPSASTTVEFGGISGFSGLETSMTWQTVPEPASLSLLIVGGMMLLSRRITNHHG
jgi:hypothetical protein